MLWVLFDLDGTLIDSFDTVVAHCRRAVSKLTGKVSTFPYASYRHRDLHGFFDDVARHEHLSLDTFKQCYDTCYAEAFAEGTTLNAEPSQWVDTFRRHGLGIAVVTDKQTEVARLVCGHFLPHKVDVVIGRNGTRSIKHGGTLGTLLTQQGVQPADCLLYVGDSDTDACCARQLNVPFVRVTHGGTMLLETTKKPI